MSPTVRWGLRGFVQKAFQTMLPKKLTTTAAASSHQARRRGPLSPPWPSQAAEQQSGGLAGHGGPVGQPPRGMRGL